MAIALSLLCCVLSPFVANAQITGTSASTVVQQFGNNSNNPQICNSVYSYFSNPITCIGVSIATFIGTTIIWLASWVLTVSGMLFNWSISETITYFAQFVNQNLINAINTTWSAFRDISNIVIIGMFTFIAIMTILGNTEYGYKKMLSRVLIVAVLINFSLLFTKIIIDVSNFTAIQFFSAAGNVIAQSQQFAGTASNASAGATSGQTTGIAGAFLQYAGANSFGDTASAVAAIAHNPSQGGTIALTYGVVVGLLELIAALVLFYGSFLLISRGILMIFLMITSSVAFASYLIPSDSARSYGWSAWWSALLKNALFAPLLAVLLWVTLTVAGAFNATVSQSGSVGSLGALVTNPTASVDISALFGYLIVIGLLFVSFKVSSSFASTVGGLSYGQGVFDRAWAATQSGFAGAGRFFGQQTGGRLAYQREQTQTKIAQENYAKASAARANKDLAGAERFERAAEKASRNAARYSSLSGTYGKNVKERAKKVAEIVQKAQPSKEMRKAQTDAQQSAAEIQNRSQAAANVVTVELKKAFDADPTLKEKYENDQSKVTEEGERNASNINKKYNDQMRVINEELDRGGIRDDRKAELRQQLLRSEESRKSELRHESERVERAQRIALRDTANSEAAKAALARNETLRNAAEQLSRMTALEADNGPIDSKKLSAAHEDTTRAMIDRVTKSGISNAGMRKDVSEAARKQFRTNAEGRTLRQVFSTQMEEALKDKGTETK